MKLIGIIGKSGSGKTTLARMLQKDDSIAVIHLDDVTNMKSIVKRMPKAMIQDYTNNIGEEFIIPNAKIRNMLNVLRENKIFNKLYINALRLPQEISIKRQIKKYEKEGKKCTIIERLYIRKSFSL